MINDTGRPDGCTCRPRGEWETESWGDGGEPARTTCCPLHGSARQEPILPHTTYCGMVEIPGQARKESRDKVVPHITYQVVREPFLKFPFNRIQSP